MKYRGHVDYDGPDDAITVIADSRRKAAEAIAEKLDAEIKSDDQIPGSRNIIVWPAGETGMDEYDCRREFEVSARIAYFAKAVDE